MHMIKQDQSKVHNMDLLWRYYEKNRNFGKAAHVLARLADMHRSGRKKNTSLLKMVSLECFLPLWEVTSSNESVHGLIPQHRDLSETTAGVSGTSHSVCQEFVQHLRSGLRRRVPSRAGGKDGGLWVWWGKL